MVGDGRAIAVTARGVPSSSHLPKTNTPVATVPLETRGAGAENKGPVSPATVTGLHGAIADPSAACRGMDQEPCYDPAGRR